MKFKTEPNLGTRGIILPVLGEVQVEKGIINLTPENWRKIAKLDFGIKLVNVEGEPEPEEVEEDEIDKTEKSEPLQKPVEVEPLNEVGEVEQPTDTQEASGETDSAQPTFDELMTLKRDELVENALQVNELKNLGLEKEIKAKSKKDLANFILENI